MISVALLSPPFAGFSYACPPWLPESIWQPGLRVAIPFGKGLRAGIVLGPAQEKPGLELKTLLWPLEPEPLLSPEYMEMIRQLAARQMISPGRILGSILPRGLRQTSRVKLREFRQGKVCLHTMKGLYQTPAEELHDLGKAWAAGQAELLNLGQDAAEGEICSLTVEPPWPVRPQATKQRELLDFLLNQGMVSRRRLLDALPGCAPTLASLLKGGQVVLQPLGEELDEMAAVTEDLLPPPPPPFELNPQQQQALQACLLDVEAGRAATHLLFGVTGSGKTAVYLELARRCLELGKSALLLAPEVALAYKLRRDAAQRFPAAPIFLSHGYQNPGLRENVFRELARRKEPCLVVGTRSALFLPLPPLGALVLDEEHDASFKQDEGLSYQAKEVAWFRASQNGAVLLLASATPDIKTFHAAREGALPMSVLPVRAGGGRLPQVELVDISDRQHQVDTLLAPPSLEALKQTLADGDQAVVLLNRRGYAPLMFCLDCKTVARCPHCDIALTYHKRREQLVCHYCGHTRPFPSPCLKCKGLHYLPMGEGTEKLEEELSPLLPPGGRILRLDKDSTSRPGRMEEILAAFARREAQILVGTQMLSKGHHFPHVTLALVADADLGLNLPDYRAAERTFQILLQSAGRAGRGEKPGRVLIQTRDTRHYCWDYVRKADYEGFYAHEIALRQKRRYPPFVKLALVRFSFAFDCKDGLVHVNRMAEAMRAAAAAHNVTVLGPAPAPLARLQARLRFQCLLKASNWPGLRQVFAEAMRHQPPASLDIRTSLDLDPVNML